MSIENIKEANNLQILPQFSLFSIRLCVSCKQCNKLHLPRFSRHIVWVKETLGCKGHIAVTLICLFRLS